MSYKSLKNWDRGQKEPLLSKLTERVHHQEPLKERISQCIYRLRVQQNRLEGANQNRLEGANLKTQQHDKSLFDKCVQAQMAKDTARSTMYANEIAEIRKMARITMRSELALEQVVLRLETIQEFGDVAATMGPIAGVVQAIKNQVQGVIPQVGYELGEISDALNGVVMEVGEATGQSYDFEASGTEAQKILSEANTVADTRMREKFPELPSPALAYERPAESTVPR